MLYGVVKKTPVQHEPIEESRSNKYVKKICSTNYSTHLRRKKQFETSKRKFYKYLNLGHALSHYNTVYHHCESIGFGICPNPFESVRVCPSNVSLSGLCSTVYLLCIYEPDGPGGGLPHGPPKFHRFPPVSALRGVR